jgi:hypothetical protein
MSTDPINVTSADLAERLLRNGGNWERAQVATALEEVARWHVSRGGNLRCRPVADSHDTRL